MNTADRQWRDEGETLADFLRAKADQFGDRPALYFKPGFRYLSWSYRDLWEGAGRVASLLQSRGIGKGDRVLLWGPTVRSGCSSTSDARGRAWCWSRST